VIRNQKAPAVSFGSRFQPKLLIVEYVSTKRGDDDRGPMVRMHQSEARIRLVDNGELVWVEGPRRKEIAELVIDNSIPAGRVALRDIAGVALAEHVIVVKPDLDTPPGVRQVG
jgi:anaerobic selenocysteine-containing dehydrogenase